MLSNRIKFRHQLTAMWLAGSTTVVEMQQTDALSFGNTVLTEPCTRISNFRHNSLWSCDLYVEVLLGILSKRR